MDLSLTLNSFGFEQLYPLSVYTGFPLFLPGILLSSNLENGKGQRLSTVDSDLCLLPCEVDVVGDGAEKIQGL